MAIKALGHKGDDFINKFVKAATGDSTGLDASQEFVAPQSGLTATGGVISDYVSGTDVYRVHKFTGSGTFTVSEIGDFGDNVDILSVGGGGSGGSYGTNIHGGKPSPPNSGSSYQAGFVGSATTTSGFPAPFTAPGGGAGGVYPGVNGGPGGSGGGGGGPSGSGGSPDSPPQGNSGGSGAATDAGGGGGGAGANGENGTPSPTAHGSGGIGKRAWDDANAPFSLGAKGPSPGAWFAGGGAGGGRGPGGAFAFGGGFDGTSRVPNYTSGPFAGGGTGGGSGSRPAALNIVGDVDSQGQDGFNNTGGGGGGGDVGNGAGHGGGGAGGYNESTDVPISTSPGEYKIYIGAGAAGINTYGGRGGSGVFLIRYQIGEIGGTAKATGGDISFYGGKTIHTITNSQTIEFPASFSETVEYVLVAGGGGGGGSQGGGGGAGGYRTGSVSVVGPLPACPVIIGAGGYGRTPSNPVTISTMSPAQRGGQSSFGLPTPIVVTGGGAGATYGGSLPSVGNGLDGSGGGNSGGGSPKDGGSSGSYGNDGGDGSGNCGGGGGGAGAAGSNGTSPSAQAGGGDGGAGVEVPATFRNPDAVLSGSPGSNAHYLAGGGGGGTLGTGGGGAGGAGGGGTGGSPASPGSNRGTMGYPGTGSGGGGGGPAGGDNGGSGILIIAYPT
tara:strand:- start:484 stop:2481 length:1998 start_codon:yes stop_codon:yes gene_type:complete